MEQDYISGTVKAKPFTCWWLRVRPCKNAVQIGPEGIPPCVEFYVPWWGWPFELLHRAIFGRARLHAESE